MSPPARLTLLMCAAETLGMTGFAAYPSFLPLLTGVWRLSGAEAGLIGGALFFGYMLAVPFLSGATDRIDARLVYVASCVLMAAGTLGFALLARGVWSGAFFQALCGAGLAGCYMPGLRVLTDRVSTAASNRPIAFYTASFGIGTSLSLLLAGGLGSLMDWRIAIALMAVGPLLAAVIVFAATAPHAPPGAALARWLPRFGPVLAHPRVRQLVTGYAVHCWELFGLRSWMVAFIAFAYGLSSAQAALSPTEAAALINLLGLPIRVC